MRKMIVVLLCLLMVAWFVYCVMYGESEQVLSENEGIAVVKSDESELQKQSPENEQNFKRQQMGDRFADLKEIRKKIRMRLSRLSSRLRRSEFPPKEAKTISQDMRRASYLLKNPKLLGAFSDLREIEDEIEQLSEINIKLDAVKKSLDEKRKNKP